MTTSLARLPPREEDAIHVNMYADHKLLTSFDNYYFTTETYQNCFMEIGFVDFECNPLTYLGMDDEEWRHGEH